MYKNGINDSKMLLNQDFSQTTKLEFIDIACAFDCSMTVTFYILYI